MEKICIVGLGYIGLPTAAILASNGFDVHGVDINKKTVELINEGKTHIFEPDLDSIVKAVVDSGKLDASIYPKKADVFILSVPTPFKENHKPDLHYVKQATESITPYLEAGNIVILESTSPVGTTEKISEWILEKRPDLSVEEGTKNRIYIAHCPERVLPGKILKELIHNNRIIGGIDKESTKKTTNFYAEFVKGNLLETNARTAELSKLTENAFRDVNIAFANELSLICDDLNINVWELIELANQHPRVNILQPGPGVGGHCIAVDPWFIVDAAPKTARLIETARVVNDSKPIYVLEKIRELSKGIVNPSIACLGLSFKANIDDLRESPAVEIVKHLSHLNIGNIYAVEPHINELPQQLKDLNIQLTGLHDAISQSDIVLVLVDHDVFKEIGEEIFTGKLVYDTKGIFKLDNKKEDHKIAILSK